ncbi:RNA-binding region-containing protein 3-like [Clavelina lepadiformis]|uniref:RNA-binding region-containing protein 3-like n=1 Tax=Clavelina lepadiformis TaxID=159417 RepID=UPI0040433E57
MSESKCSNISITTILNLLNCKPAPLSTITMATNVEAVKDRVDSDTLLVKHLPMSLTADEKADLLKCFGATEVRVMSVHGRLKHCAFATFPTPKQASEALSRLHQLEVLGHALSVEYAKAKLQNHIKSIDVHKGFDGLKEQCCKKGNKPNDEKRSKAMNGEMYKSCTCERKLPPIAPHFGLQYPANPKYKYQYPDPTADVLLNICGALLTVPKFYTQVLHLMNKMNLFCPFSTSALIPPILLEHVTGTANSSIVSDQVPVLPAAHPKIHLQNLSSSESELESDEMRYKSLDILPPERSMKAFKRKRSVLSNEPKRKLARYQKGKKTATKSEALVATTNINAKTDLSEIFQRPCANDAKHDISLIIPSNISPVKKLSHILAGQESIPNEEKAEGTGFGKINPLQQPTNQKEVDDEKDYILTTDFITEKQLESGKLSEKEMSSHSLFKNYHPGQPSCRLYIKNLAKKVTEKDLQHIFGRFINIENEDDIKMFDVRVMNQGRMKGQAFVGLSSVVAATKAVKLVNGYQLINKPMVVSFARSAKPNTSSQS